MQYLLFCCFEEKRWQELPEEQRGKIMEEYLALEQDLSKSGHYRAGAKLGPSSTTTTVRIKAGKPAITDGPFAETKEQVGGYHLIECSDLDEAIAIANESEYGLGGSVWTKDIDKGIYVAERVESGAVYVNKMMASDPLVPFGGIKKSGYGRELSHLGIKEFVNQKTIWIN